MIADVLKTNPPLFMRLGLLLWLTLPSYLVFSQDRCGTVPYMQQLRNEGKIRQTDEQFEQWMAQRLRLRQQLQLQKTKEGPYEIPVVVHVIHNGELEGTGTNISDAQILSQIEVLNKDFKRLNADAGNTPAEFLTVAGSLDIEFVMARRDPDGLPTSGINRVQGTKTAWSRNPDDAVFKALSYWPSKDYLNIWVIKFSNIDIGYAQFPVSNLPGLEEYQDGLAETDGIVVDYTVFGSVDYGDFELDPQFNKGRTATHELGHFFGLRHIWGDRNDCDGTDYVADTPNQTTSTTGCPPHPQVSCTNNKMFQNYLDYTDDACMNIFTQGQVNRMELILEDADVPRRKSLLTSPGLLDPDCAILDMEIVRIESPGPVICTSNNAIQMSVRNRSCFEISSIAVAYTLNNGTPQTIPVSFTTPFAINETKVITLPELNFNQYENIISLSIEEVNGSPDEDAGNSTLDWRIIVDPSTDRIPLRENFDLLTWAAINPTGGTNWQLSSTNFGNSASVQAFNTGTIGEEAWLVSPVLDFSVASKASLFFDLSYAWNPDRNDRLKILASTDCGNLYFPTEFNPNTQQLANGRTSSVSWQPASQADWQLRTYLNLNDLAGEENVRLAFVFTNAAGNNLYIDNVEFFLSDNPNPVDIGSDLYSIYWSSPNEASITFNLPQRMPVDIQVVDILGRTYIHTTAHDILNQTFPIDLGQANAGIYLMRIKVNGQLYVRKFYLPGR